MFPNEMPIKTFLTLLFLLLTRLHGINANESARRALLGSRSENASPNLKEPSNDEEKCGGILIANKRNKTLTSPGWPLAYPSRRSCDWTIKTRTDGYRIRIEFLFFETEHCCDHLELFDGESEIRRYRGVIRSIEPFVSSNSELTLLFHSDRSEELGGFELIYRETNTEMPSIMVALPPAPCGFDAVVTLESHRLNSPEWPNNYKDNMDCVWRLTAKEGKQVQLDFISFFTEKCCDSLTITDGETRVAYLKGTEIPEHSIVSTSGSLVLQFRSDHSIARDGFQAKYSEWNALEESNTAQAPCGFTATGTPKSKDLNSPGYPAIYAPRLECEWILNANADKQILLEIFTFDTEKCCDYLTISSGVNQTVTLKGLTKNRRFVSTSGYLLLHFHSDSSHQRYGFQGRYFEISNDTSFSQYLIDNSSEATFAHGETCGFNAVANARPQFLNSPGWPLKYASLQECLWRLSAVSGKQVELNFIFVDTEACCDTLAVYDSNRRLHTVRGKEKPSRVFRSTQRILLLRFHSDHSIQHKGFQATFIEVDSDVTDSSTGVSLAPCGFNATASHLKQALNSPRYPSNYSSNEDCTWVLQAEPQHTLVLEILSISTEICCDYLEIYDGDTSIMTLQGFQLPSTPYILTSNTGKFSLRFISDVSSQYRGFEARFFETGGLPPTAPSFTKSTTSTISYGCGFKAIATDTPKVFTTPNFPQPYTSNLLCVWLLEAPTEDTYIELNILDFNVEECCDHVAIFDEGVQVAKMAGTTTPFRIYRSRSQTLEIRFHSDTSMETPGFRFSYSTSNIRGTYEPSEELETCGFDAVASNVPAYFTSPGWPHSYENSKNCTWRITAPLGSRIQFNFTFFNTEACCDYLELREDSMVLGRLQGDVGSTVVDSDGGIVTLTFSTDSSVVQAGFRASFILKPMEEATKKGVRCYSGLMIVGEGININEERGSPFCESGSSCVDVTASGISSLGDSGIPATVDIAIGLCLPTYVCGGVTCNQVQDQVSPLLATDLKDCNIMCCNHDFCNTPNRPTAKSPEISPSSAIPLEEIIDYDQCLNNDVDFLPGCTYREFYNQVWLCSSLFFNHFPYMDIRRCSTSLELYRGCVHGVRTKCNVGTKPIFARYNPELSEEIRIGLIYAFGNLSTIIDPTYEVFCNKNEEAIGDLSGGFLSSLSSLISTPFCDTNLLSSSRETYHDLVDQLIRANPTDTCKIYSDVCHMVLEVTRACSIDVIERGTPFTEIQLQTKKLLRIIPDLLSEYAIPKCAAYIHLDRYQPAEPEIQEPIIFSQPDANGCWMYNFDLMFLIDGSGSVKPQDFLYMIQFVKDVSTSFNLKENKVGVLQYSYWYPNRPITDQPYLKTEIELGEYTNKLLFSIAADKIEHHGFQSYAARAIQKALNINLASSERRANPCTKKVIVLITDGSATDHRALQTIGDAARALGVHLYSVGIQEFVLEQLQAVANGVVGNNEHVFTVEKFSDLHTLAPLLRDELLELLNGRVAILKSSSTTS